MSLSASIRLLALLVLAAAVSAEEPPTICDPTLLRHAPPSAPPWDAQAPFVTVYDWSADRETVPLGIGHVRGASSFWWSDSHVRLPLHASPGGEPWSWFADGWLVPAGLVPGKPEPIGLEGTVETEYEATSFIVLEERPDGWLRIRYGKPSNTGDGTAWTHRCQLNRDGLAYERWEKRFSSDEISPLFFRDGAPHTLRAEPDDGADPVAPIDGDYHLEPLAFQGDWMKVRLKQPSDHCADPDPVLSREGWIRWRSAKRGPLVWYYTRGC